MNSKALRGVVFLFLFIFFISFISAEVCSITTKISCTSPNIAVMALSAATNAQGGLLASSSSYNSVLCCDFAGSSTCTETNTVLRLSSTTNAHAEIPSGTTSAYSTKVCYGNLRCSSQTGGTCPLEYPMTMFSLTSATNAQIGGFGDYLIKICCKTLGVTIEGPPYSYPTDPTYRVLVTRTDPFFQNYDTNSKYETTVYSMIQAKTWSSSPLARAEIYTYRKKSGIEELNGGSLFQKYGVLTGNDGKITVNCTLEGVPTNVVKTCKVIVNGVVTQFPAVSLGNLAGTYTEEHAVGVVNAKRSVQSNNLSFTVGGTMILPPVPPTSEAYWTDSVGTRIDASPETILEYTKVRMVLTNSGLPAGSINFEIYEYDGWPLDDQNIRTGANAIAGTVDVTGKATAEWTITQADIDAAASFMEGSNWEFKFKANGKVSSILTVTLRGAPDPTICEQIKTCADYTSKTYCETDNIPDYGCGVAKYYDIETCGKIVAEEVEGYNNCKVRLVCNCVWEGSEADGKCVGPNAQEKDEGACTSKDPNKPPLGPDSGKGGCTNYPLTSLGDDCIKGFFCYSYKSVWNWNKNVYDTINAVPGYDPIKKNSEVAFQTIDGTWHRKLDYLGWQACEDCKNSCTTSVPYPSALALPFFTTLEVVATLIAIVFIYYFIFKFKKKNKTGKKISKRKPKSRK